MRLLTYVNLRSLIKGVENGFPLMLEIEDMEVVEAEFDHDFLVRMIPSLEWQAVVAAASAVGLEGIPEIWQDDLVEDNDFLKAMHSLLMEIHVTTGTLTCPESGRKFPIANGRPDMR